MISMHILAHFEDHNILIDLQHGFMSGGSCETKLVINYISGPSSNAEQKKEIKVTSPS